ncbi:MAG: hypothetical protein Q9N26_01105 [Aquificota bacterium]|nr:hypothetical protein [Aquificota bacterium]
MTQIKITEDTPLKDLLEVLPESRDLLMELGLSKIADLGVEDVVVDRLTLKGLLRLGGVTGEKIPAVIREIQDLYNKKLEET